MLDPSRRPLWFAYVRDSKLLSRARREALAQLIWVEATGAGIGVVPASEIDRAGIVAATREAMRRALFNLAVSPDHLLIDALTLPETPLPQTAIVHGDRLSLSIACASIIAKVARDRMMCALDARFSGFGLASHKGYGTAAHLEALSAAAPSPIHRRSFAPLRLLGDGHHDRVQRKMDAPDGGR